MPKQQSLLASIGLIMGTLALVECHGASLPQLAVTDFLGPEPGKAYVYEGEEELRVEVVGIESLSPARIRVRETATLHLADGNESSSTTSYDLAAIDGQLIQENSLGRDVLLAQPIRDRGASWNIAFALSGENREASHPLPATCHITSVRDSVVIGTQTQTVTVECVSESEDLPVIEGQQATRQRFVITRQFAKSIGLVSEHVELRIDSESIAMTSRVLTQIVEAGSDGVRP